MSDTEPVLPGPDDSEAMHGVLRAVLVADAAGYSRLMPEDPAGTIVSLNRHRERMRDIVRRNNGREAGFPGDYLLALFSSTADALASAVEFLKQQDDAAGRIPLRFRVGLHVGDVFERSEDTLGVAINLATRLQQAAPIGGIVMSQSFRQSLPGRLRLDVHDLGDLHLKNVDEPVRAFEVLLPGVTPRDTASAPGPTAAAPAMAAPHGASGPERRPRLYIRPFRSLGKAERASVFADGLVEELVTTLGVFTKVFRIVQSSGTGERGEGYEITGQVRNGDRLRITCQLVDRSTGDTLWADRFDFGNDASYDAQERIAVAVVTALQLKLTDGETSSLWSSRPTSLPVWEEFHRGRMCEARYTSDSNCRARAHFARAIDIDADYVPAIVALGFNHLDAVRLGWSIDTEADLARANSLAESALGKDPGDPYAIALLSYVQRAQGMPDRSVATMESAVRVAPRNGELVAYLAHLLWLQGDLPAAVAQHRRALELTPQPGSWVRANLGLALLWNGRLREAQQTFEAVIAGDAEYVRAYIGLAVSLVRQQKFDAAREAYRALLLIEPGFQPRRWMVQNSHFNPPDCEAFIADLLRAAD